MRALARAGIASSGSSAASALRKVQTINTAPQHPSVRFTTTVQQALHRKKLLKAFVYLLQRPTGPYIFFCSAKRPDVKKKNPELSAPDTLKELGALWSKATEEEKKVSSIALNNNSSTIALQTDVLTSPRGTLLALVLAQAAKMSNLHQF